MKHSPVQFRLLLAFLLLAGVASVLWAVAHYTGAPLPPQIFFIVCWAAVLAFCGYAYSRRSLTVARAEGADSLSGAGILPAIDTLAAAVCDPEERAS